MKKKILHIITSIDNGGAENHLTQLILDQVKIYSVYLIYFKGNNFNRKILKDCGVGVFKINFFKKNILSFILNFYKLIKIYKKIKPQIIHCHLWISEIYGILLKLIYKKNIKLIISKHLDSYIFEGSFGRKLFFNGYFLERVIFKLSDHFIFISKSVKNYFLKNIYLSKTKYSIIHYGINIKKFKNLKFSDLVTLKKKLHIEKNSKFVGCVARHEKQKNIDLIIKAFARTCANNPDVKLKLIIVGRGSLTNYLKNMANKLMINNKIIWVSYTKKINLYFRLFNVFCLPSKYEGFGLVLLEALAFGLPIVATKSGSIPEIIKNKKNGFLVNHNDHISFSHRIKDCLCLNKDNNFKNRQIKFLKKNFSTTQVFLKTDKVYERYIN